MSKSLLSFSVRKNIFIFAKRTRSGSPRLAVLVSVVIAMRIFSSANRAAH